MSISATCKKLILTEPYYGIFASGLQKEVNNSISTAGVSKQGIGVKLSYNEEFFNNLSKEHRYGLIKHELMHIALGHLVIRDKYSDKRIFNIAADLQINQYIDSKNLPDGGLTLGSFPELKLPSFAGTNEYYKILKQANQDGECESLNNILDQMDGKSMYDHETWDDFDNLSPTEQKLIQKQIEHQLKETADSISKSCGSIPGELSDIIKRIKNPEPPKFDWKGYLRRVAGNSTISYTKKMRRKYNKRYVDNPGLKIKYKNHILVGIDTSGSVSQDELKEFYKEIVHMHKTGHMITVVQCDTKINKIEKFNPRKDWEIHGRGGTEFQPVIDHYNEKKCYNSLIYLTDGECYPPDNCPKNTLWVLSSRSNMNNNLPGRVIKLN